MTEISLNWIQIYKVFLFLLQIITTLVFRLLLFGCFLMEGDVKNLNGRE